MARASTVGSMPRPLRTTRFVIWGAAAGLGVILLVLEAVDVFPEWLLVGPVLLGIAGAALLADQIVCSPDRKGGYGGALLMIALSAGTVTQDAGLVVDSWSIWPFLAGTVVIGVPLEILAARRRRIHPTSGS